MLVNILQTFDWGPRRYFPGENPDVAEDVGRKWIAEGKATPDTDNVPDRSTAVNLAPGQWQSIPSISRLRVVGTGSLSIDSRDRAGTVTTAVFTGSYASATGTIEFPYYGDAAVQIRATFPATLTVEVI